MDFLDPKKKRAQLIKLYIGYALVAVAIGIGTIVLLYASFGYGVDRHTGQVIQNGLVFVASKPDGAAIKVVGADKKAQPPAQTDTRLTIPAGQYTVSLAKDGYRPWQRNITLDGGSVERLVYPVLFPQTLTTREQQTYTAAPSLMTESPDRHWLLVLKPGTHNQFDVFDANDPKQVPKIALLPDTVFSPGTTHSLEVVEWSSNNKNLLLKHTFDGNNEFILMNHENTGDSININKTFNMVPLDVVLYDKQPEQVYLHIQNGGLLQLGNLKDRKITPMLTNVVAFKPHGTDMIEYITDSTLAGSGKVSVRLHTKDNDYTVRELPGGTTYVLDIARFDNHWFVVVGAQSENKVYVYEDPLNVLAKKDPKTTLNARTMRLEKPTHVSFSNNARFIAAQGGQQFAVYDAETDRQYRYQLAEPLDGMHPATWMDGHRLLSVSADKVLVFDFDGSNIQSLNRSLPTVTPVFNREYLNLYTLAPSDQTKGGAALTMTEMRVK